MLRRRADTSLNVECATEIYSILEGVFPGHFGRAEPNEQRTIPSLYFDKPTAVKETLTENFRPVLFPTHLFIPATAFIFCALFVPSASPSLHDHPLRHRAGVTPNALLNAAMKALGLW